ncbi:MAG TPA: elongation factor P [bacterium]|nr:elongation factor P [bacterium]
MANAVDLRKGMAIMLEGELCVVTDRLHVTPGNWRAYIQVTMKSVRTGKQIERRFRSTETVDVVQLEPKEMQFMYKDQEGFHFMDPDYNTITFSEEVVGDAKNYLIENGKCEVLFFGEKAIEIELPASVELKVVETVPGFKGDSVTNLQKPATLETGYRVNVPLFMKEGDVVKIDTRTGEYIGRG